jgi:hypothetical protein
MKASKMSGKHDRLADLPVAKPAGSILLNFDVGVVGNAEELHKLRCNLSGVEIHDDHIWVVSDETWSVERLTRQTDGETFADHRRFTLPEPFDLPFPEREIDLEGLSVDGTRLWLLGSHCLARTSVEKALAKANQASDALERMEIKNRRKRLNRCLLGCLDLNRLPADGPHVAAEAAAKVPHRGEGNILLEAIAADHQLAPFLELPAKDNGLDFEGLAVRGKTAFVGLRGPVLGGQAIVLELRITIDEESGTVQLQNVNGARRFIKHAFDLQGLGVRDLAFHGDELLILAAPTMALDAVAAVFAWRFSPRSQNGGIIDKSRYRPIVRLPGGNDGDYAEGFATTKNRLLVVNDRPLPNRLKSQTGILADMFAIS